MNLVELYDGTDMEMTEEGTRFLVAGNGNFIQRKTEFYESKVMTTDPLPGFAVPSIDGNSCEIDFEFDADFLREGLGFLRKVAQIHGNSEAALVILKHPDHGLRWYCPKQSVQPAHVAFENPDIEDGWMRYGDIHSHPGFSNDPSGIDEHDETHLDGFHLIASGLDPDNTDISCTFCVDGERFRDDDLVTTPDGSWPEPPQQWLDQVTRVVYHAPAKSSWWPSWMGGKTSHADPYVSTYKYKTFVLGSDIVKELLDELQRQTDAGNIGDFDPEIIKRAEEYLE